MNSSTYQPTMIKKMATIHSSGRNNIKFDLTNRNSNLAQVNPILKHFGIQKDIHTLMSQINKKTQAMFKQTLFLFCLNIFLTFMLVLIWILDFKAYTEFKTFLTLFLAGIFVVSIIGICHSLNSMWRQEYLILISDFNAKRKFTSNLIIEKLKSGVNIALF